MKQEKSKPTHLVLNNSTNTVCGRQRTIFIMVVSTDVKNVNCKRCLDIVARKQDPIKYL